MPKKQNPNSKLGLKKPRFWVFSSPSQPYLNPDHFPALEKLFTQIYETSTQAITSIITYIELTNHPARQGKAQLVRKYRDYLTNSENISLVPLDFNIADHAVELRAQYHFKTPDAIQINSH